jgi:transposase
MTEEHTEATGLKVITVGRDGKRRFDRQTKQKLVEACLEPGASVAGLALKHGVNANLPKLYLEKCVDNKYYCHRYFSEAKLLRHSQPATEGRWLDRPCI